LTVFFDIFALQILTLSFVMQWT